MAITRKPDDEDDSPPPPPVEPNGQALTEKRKQQKAGREAAEKLWNLIVSNMRSEHESD